MKHVKICGITNLNDARFAASEGASAIGFIFHKLSPRYVHPKLASKIVAKMKNEVSFVGVFVNESLDQIDKISKQVGLDFIQLHGDETPLYCNKVKMPIIKVFRISDDFDDKILKDYDVHAFLFDTYEEKCHGGTGNIFNWELIRDLNMTHPMILSGGLNEENIQDAIKITSPDGLDVNSGVEKEPGIKSLDKIRSLFNVIENTQSMINPFHRVGAKEARSGI